MYGGRDRTQWIRLIAQVAIRTGWSFEEVGRMEPFEFRIVLEELTGKRRMSDRELAEQLHRWREALHSSSAQTPAS
jgi:hypothetical protein